MKENLPPSLAIKKVEQSYKSYLDLNVIQSSLSMVDMIAEMSCYNLYACKMPWRSSFFVSQRTLKIWVKWKKIKTYWIFYQVWSVLWLLLFFPLIFFRLHGFCQHLAIVSFSYVKFCVERNFDMLMVCPELHALILLYSLFIQYEIAS